MCRIIQTHDHYVMCVTRVCKKVYRFMFELMMCMVSPWMEFVIVPESNDDV